MRTKVQIYLGYDPREDAAYQVARESIRRRCSTPLSIIPLRLEHLPMLTRPIEHRDGKLWCPISNAPMSTEFAISRFCVPFLQREGWALFGDCDIICWSDINELFALADDKFAVMCVKHQLKEPITEIEHSGSQSEAVMNYMASQFTKMDGQEQTFYARKNWSSVVLWNCDHPANKRLTLEALNTWPGRDLHAFKWLEDSEIGELPQHWNWLVNVTPGEPEKKGIWHYTLGLPIFENWTPAKHDDAWLEEADALKIKSVAA
jgi:lipopolysaccharide biosynthesis glycosyltransferase